MKRSQDADAGFTLVELLVSLSLLSMMAVLLGAAVVPGRHALQRMEARSDAEDGVVAAQDLLRDRIAHLMPVARQDRDNPVTEVVGAPDAFNFYAPGPQSDGPAELRRYTLTVTPANDLVLVSASDLALDPRPARREVLLRGVRALAVAYYGAASPASPPQWLDRWEAAPEPPRLVSIRVAFTADDHRVWPELLIRPMASVSTGCVLNPSTGRCWGTA